MFVSIRFCSIVLISVCCMTVTVRGTLQQITFFQRTYCMGESDTITETQNDLNATRVGRALSMHILGLWKISGYKRLPDGQLTGKTITFFQTKPPTGTCGAWDSPGYTGYTIVSAQRLGGADMTESQVVFYTGDNFDGEQYTVEQDMSQVGPEPVKSLSYVLLSDDSWAVYPGQNFTGWPTVIRPEHGWVLPLPEDPSDNISFKRGEEYIVGSIRKVVPTTTTTLWPTSRSTSGSTPRPTSGSTPRPTSGSTPRPTSRSTSRPTSTTTTLHTTISSSSVTTEESTTTDPRSTSDSSSTSDFSSTTDYSTTFSSTDDGEQEGNAHITSASTSFILTLVTVLILSFYV